MSVSSVEHEFVDRRLPQLDILFDRDAMRERFQQWIMQVNDETYEAGGRSRQVVGCELMWTKYRPGEHCRVAFRLDVREAMTARVSTHLVHGRMLPLEEAEAFWRSGLQRPLIDATLGYRLDWLPEIGLVIWGFPNDRKMASLSKLIDLDELATRLSAMETAARGVMSRVEIESHDIVQYVPEQACTARVRATVIDVRGGREWCCWYLKAFADPEVGMRSYRSLRTLADSLPDKGEEVTLASVSDFWPDVAIRVQRAVSGRPLAELRRDRQLYEQALAAAGQSIATLHQRVIPGLDVVDRRNSTTDSIARVITLLERVAPHELHRAQRLASLLNSAIADDMSSPCVPCHGDLHVRNLLWHEGRVGLIDLDDLCLNAAEYDLASFLGGMIWQALQERSGFQEVRRYADIFLRAYQDRRPLAVDPDRLRRNLAYCCFVERLYRCVTQHHRRYRDLVGRLIEVAEQMLRDKERGDLDSIPSLMSRLVERRGSS